MPHFSIENGSEQNHKLIGRKITSEGLVALPLRRSFKNKFEACKDEDGEMSNIRAIRRHSGEMIIRPRLRSQVEDSLQGCNPSVLWIEPKSLLNCRS